MQISSVLLQPGCYYEEEQHIKSEIHHCFRKKIFDPIWLPLLSLEILSGAAADVNHWIYGDKTLSVTCLNSEIVDSKTGKKVVELIQ